MNLVDHFFAKPLRFVLVLSLLTFILTNIFSYFVFDHIPHIHDSIAQLFQAKIFLTGHLYFPSPSSKEYFDFPHMINNGKWYSQYPPGYPFLLLLGLVLGMPWIVNPLFGSLSIIIFYYLGKELFNEKVGLLAAFLGSFSPFLLFMASNLMSHTTCMFFFSLFLLFFFRSLREPSLTNGLISGASIGICFLIRPFTAICLALPFGVLYGFNVIRDFRRLRKNMLALSSIVAISIFILLLYNFLTNGHPSTMGYIVCHGEGHNLGFGKSGWGPPHTPLLGAINTFDYIKSLNTYLLEWPFSSFFGLFALFICYKFCKISKEQKFKTLLLFSGFVALLLGYFFYWWEFNLFGPRMIFESLPILLVLSAFGIIRFSDRLANKSIKVRSSSIKGSVAVIIGIFIFYAFVIRVPFLINGSKDKKGWISYGYGNDFAGTSPRIHNTMKALKIENGVVLIKMMYKPLQDFPTGWWDSGFLHNSPTLNTQIIYARHIGEKIPSLFKDFPRRKFYLYLGTLEKGMVIPLERKGHLVAYGEPVVKEIEGSKYVKLLKEPEEFFRAKNTEIYQSVWKQLKKGDVYQAIDVLSLSNAGNSYKRTRDFSKAAVYFELALQIEISPSERAQLLNELISCYLKLGRSKEANELLHEFELIMY